MVGGGGWHVFYGGGWHVFYGGGWPWWVDRWWVVVAGMFSMVVGDHVFFHSYTPKKSRYRFTMVVGGRARIYLVVGYGLLFCTHLLFWVHVTRSVTRQ